VSIISVDVGWSERTKRNAVAIARPGRQVYLVASGLTDSDLISLVRDYAEPKSLILLDVPIEGCENLSEPRRPVESVLQHYVSLYPASMAGVRGIGLKQALLQAIPASIRTSVVIREIYPHAIYKFLWVARQKGKLESVHSGVWERLLDEGFIPSVSPPKYKGTIERDRRLAGMRELYHFLTEHLRLNLPLGFLNETFSRSRLELLADEFDACLGAMVGLYWADHSPYVWVAGDQSRGEILLLADIWLKEQLEKDGIDMRRLW
jgi:predicted RNase H-like nuclease